MRFASGENSAVSHPVHPSRLTARREPFASTRSGVSTVAPVTVTRSTVALPGAGTKHTTGAALKGAWTAAASGADGCQHPTHGVHRASVAASWVLCAPAAAADPSSTAAATIVRPDFELRYRCVVMVTALLEPDSEAHRPRDTR